MGTESAHDQPVATVDAPSQVSAGGEVPGNRTTPMPRRLDELFAALNEPAFRTAAIPGSVSRDARVRVLAGREAEPVADVDEELLRAVSARSRTARTRQFVRKKEWVGRVEEVRNDTFVASLTDVTNLGREVSEEELGEIYRVELSPGDEKYLQRGATFYWVIGYMDEPHGQRISRSQFIFRRPLALSADEEETAKSRAALRWKQLRSRHRSKQT